MSDSGSSFADYLLDQAKTSPNTVWIIHLALLFTLLITPVFSYDMFRELGEIRLFFLVALLHFALVGITAFHLPRLLNWYPPKLWLYWLISGFFALGFTWAADTTLARAIQVSTFLFSLLFIFLARRREYANWTPVAFGLTIFFIVNLCGVSWGMTDKHSWVGQCHLFSPWRDKGCVYSFVLPNRTYAFLSNRSSSENLTVLILEKNRIWFYPQNPMTNAWQTHALTLPNFDNGILAGGYVREQQNQLYVMYYQWYLGLHYLLITGELLIDLNEEVIVDQNHLEITTEEEEQAYIDQLTAFETRPVSSDEPLSSFRSTDGQLMAMTFRNGRVALWQRQQTEDTNELGPLEPLPSIPTPPTTTPFWTIEVGINYDCLAFSPDHQLMVAHAGVGDDLLHLYNLVEQRLVWALPFEANGPCPAFSHNGQWLILADNIDRQQLWLLDVQTGETITSLQLDVYNYQFSADDEWLLIHKEDNVDGVIEEDARALLFRMDRLIAVE